MKFKKGVININKKEKKLQFKPNWINHDTKGKRRSMVGFEQIPFSLANYPDLSVNAIVLYAVLANSSGLNNPKKDYNTGRTRISNEELMRRTHIKSQSTLNRTIKELEEYGIIKRKNSSVDRRFEILKNFNEVQKEELEYFKKDGYISADDMKNNSKGDNEDDFDW